jgi:hypothetical protein
MMHLDNSAAMFELLTQGMKAPSDSTEVVLTSCVAVPGNVEIHPVDKALDLVHLFGPNGINEYGLATYMYGRLPERQERWIRHHLTRCPHCEQQRIQVEVDLQGGW